LAGVRASYKATALAMSPLRLWMFDETSGTTAADSSGNGVNLTLTNGPALNAGGPIGRFCEFDGTDDYATGAATSLTGEWSAVALVRIDTQADRQIVGNWMAGTATQRWVLGMTATGIEVFSYNSGYSGFGAAVTLTGGAWKLVGVSRRAGTNASNLYVNGVSIGVGTVAAPLGSSTTEVYRKSGGISYTDGGVAGVGVWSSALTTAQHLALASAAGLA